LKWGVLCWKGGFFEIMRGVLTAEGAEIAQRDAEIWG